MATKVVTLNKNEYKLISDKTKFIARLKEGYCEVRAEASAPAVGLEGLPLDPSIAIPREFDGNLYGKSTTETATVIVLESDS